MEGLLSTGPTPSSLQDNCAQEEATQGGYVNISVPFAYVEVSTFECKPIRVGYGHLNVFFVYNKKVYPNFIKKEFCPAVVPVYVTLRVPPGPGL